MRITPKAELVLRIVSVFTRSSMVVAGYARDSGSSVPFRFAGARGSCGVGVRGTVVAE